MLGRAALAVTHAGLNTVLDALSLGVPMLAVPVADEQPRTAARVAWAGAGEALLPFGRLTPEAMRSAISRVLRDPSYRRAARRIQSSIPGCGAPKAAELIETELVDRDRAGRRWMSPGRPPLRSRRLARVGRPPVALRGSLGRAVIDRRRPSSAASWRCRRGRTTRLAGRAEPAPGSR
ncbi:glycosyltransferase [Paludisphaera soli]|uniref:glycosyltransferase n=1 Tax=Paludisphaera soli TaxID=2712865 RepID=UPI0013EB70F3